VPPTLGTSISENMNGPALAAIVLCGGKSRRLGRSKAWLEFGGETMLQRLVRLVAQRAEPVVVAAAEAQDLPPLPHGVEVVRDARPDRGPVQGLHEGLSRLQGRADWAFVSATDTPFLHPGWIDLLRAEADADPEGSDAVLAVIGGQAEPFSALYRVEPTLEAAKVQLEAGDFRFRSLRDRLRARLVPDARFRAIDPELQTLSNLNRWGDYEAALRRFQKDASDTEASASSDVVGRLGADDRRFGGS